MTLLPLHVFVVESYHVRGPHLPGSHLAGPLFVQSMQLGEHSATTSTRLIDCSSRCCAVLVCVCACECECVCLRVCMHYFLSSSSSSSYSVVGLLQTRCKTLRMSVAYPQGDVSPKFRPVWTVSQKPPLFDNDAVAVAGFTSQSLGLPAYTCKTGSSTAVN